MAASVKSITPAMFEYFKNLTNAEKKARLHSGFQLIQHISKSSQNDKVCSCGNIRIPI